MIIVYYFIYKGSMKKNESQENYTQKTTKKRKIRYQKMSDDTRSEFLQLIHQRRPTTVRVAARMLKINLSTAKSIARKERMLAEEKALKKVEEQNRKKEEEQQNQERNDEVDGLELKNIHVPIEQRFQAEQRLQDTFQRLYSLPITSTQNPYGMQNLDFMGCENLQYQMYPLLTTFASPSYPQENTFQTFTWYCAQDIGNRWMI